MDFPRRAYTDSSSSSNVSPYPDRNHRLRKRDAVLAVHWESIDIYDEKGQAYIDPFCFT